MKFSISVPLPNGWPWGTRTANNTNASGFLTLAYPSLIRRYDFTITRAKKSPDGYLKDSLVINDQFPAPLIQANWGDTIQVTVHNKITDPPEGTGLHWHGILQKQSQVPGVTQCPIPPGGTFTYTFTADLYGTSWYHSHYSAQYAGGLVGPMVIYGPQTVAYDIDIGPLLLSDHYHREYFDLIEDVMGTDPTKIAPASDNNLINGRNNFDCSKKLPGDVAVCTNDAPPSIFKFTAGKKHRIRLINAGAEAIEKFSIDGHTMTVIANDFVPVIPYDTKVVTLGIGQRVDVIVQGITGATDAWAIRSSIAAAPCSLSNGPEAKAIAYYTTEALKLSSTGVPTMPQTVAWPDFTASVLTGCANDALTRTRPWYPIAAATTPATTKVIDINLIQNATGHILWTMNGVSFRANYNQPILLLSNLGNNSYPNSPQWNVYNFGSNSSVRIHLRNPLPIVHPIHLHGHNMQVLAEGIGTWNGAIVNPSNPQRRDVQIIQGNGYLVLQFDSDNPGAWPLHCHIAWHVSAGLYVTVLERPADIAKLNIPSIMAQTCRDWAVFTGTTVVNQIDSGLR
ncbi:Cupredoxin [Bisporella sp. PMI_857]|nr:Cupredoxin [Bisporella sp. PMI_857]